jgi:protein-tyrosine phosphatase
VPACCQARCMTDPRVIPLDGIHNFRDYGGYAVTGGGRVKSELLWRSAQHGDATGADLEAIHGLGISHVIDLRGPSERDAKPCLRHPDFAANVWTYPEETAGLALHTDAASGVMTADDARAAMLRLYEGIAFRGNLIPMLKLYLELLRRDEGPSLVHCVAGKDRTGFAVAVLQRILGVHDDDIMADYMLTNSASNLDERIAAGAFKDMPRYAAFDADSVRALWGVEAAYLQAALDAIDAQHSSFDAYLSDVLAIDASAQDDLRRIYLEA